MKKIVLVILYVLFHIFILRGIRTALFTFQVESQLIQQVEKIENLSVFELQQRMIFLTYEKPGYTKEWEYKFPFGYFFLIAITGLILIGADKKFYMILIGIHLGSVILTSIIFAVSMYFSTWLLIVCDLLSGYLVPLSSLGIVPLAFLEKRQEADEG